MDKEAFTEEHRIGYAAQCLRDGQFLASVETAGQIAGNIGLDPHHDRGWYLSIVEAERRDR